MRWSSRGHVPTRSAAFESILHWRSGYYEQYYAPVPLEGVRMIVAAGGVPVLAHPATHGQLRGRWTPARSAALVDAGLAGLEIDHRDNSEPGKRWLRKTRGEVRPRSSPASSDYHGEGKPNRLG